MQQIIYFFIRNKNFILFSALFVFAVFLSVKTHSYHHDKFFSSANTLTGGIYNLKYGVTNYFSLNSENKKLVEENLMLRQKLENLHEQVIPEFDTTLASRYKYTTATIINNNFSHTKNYLTINKGSRDSIYPDMGVISGKGLVGIVSKVSKKYATVQSILNTNSRTNAKLKESGHFGTLIWDTKKANVVQLIDIPRLADFNRGDTIVTGGRSVIFPEGILIGTVLDYRPDTNDDNYYAIDVELFNDMTSLQYAYLIENTEADEITSLEKEADVE